MTSRAQDVLREALALPLDERADVAAELLASLDDAAGPALTTPRRTTQPTSKPPGPPKSNGEPAVPSQTSPLGWHGTMGVAAQKPNFASGESSRSL